MFFIGYKFIGEGIKKIPAYKCDLAYDQLEALRKEFWDSKKRDRVWLVLESCCKTDACKIKLKLTQIYNLIFYF